jgi:glycosyltransferase involved in cell wall biosynthesis
MLAVPDLTREIPRISLTVVGDGSLLRFYVQLARRLGVSERIEFLGAVEDEHLRNIYMDSKLLVLPATSRAEGFGMALIEAQACGMAVIGSDIGGIPSALNHGATGVLVPPGNRTRLVDAIRTLLTDEEALKELSSKSMDYARRTYSWDETAGAFMSAFESAIA